MAAYMTRCKNFVYLTEIYMLNAFTLVSMLVLLINGAIKVQINTDMRLFKKTERLRERERERE